MKERYFVNFNKNDTSKIVSRRKIEFDDEFNSYVSIWLRKRYVQIWPKWNSGFFFRYFFQEFDRKWIGNWYQRWFDISGLRTPFWLCYQSRNIEIMSSACGPTVKFVIKVNSISANSLGDIPKFYEGNILLYSDFIRDRFRTEFAGCIILNHVSE